MLDHHLPGLYHSTSKERKIQIWKGMEGIGDKTISGFVSPQVLCLDGISGLNPFIPIASISHMSGLSDYQMTNSRESIFSFSDYIFSQSFPCSQAYATWSTVSSAHHFPIICTPTGNFVPDPAKEPSEISSKPMGKVKAGWPVWLN